MKTIANDTASLVEGADHFDQFAAFPLAPAGECTAIRSASGLKPLFGRGSELVSKSRLPVLPNESPEEALAIGVLSQAAHDLRRHHRAVRGLERELYLDAFSWIIIDDFEWPYSFVNICRILRISPESTREELLVAISLGWLGHWVRLNRRLSRLLRDSIARLFAKAPVATSFAPIPPADLFRAL